MDGYYRRIQKKFNLSDSKCDKVMTSFFDKLKNEKEVVAYTELEEELGDFIELYDGYVRYCYYKPWYFPLDMTENEIADAIREAYLNASKRSKRISPDKIGQVDCENLGRILEVDCCPINNYECLYQGRTGDLHLSP